MINDIWNLPIRITKVKVGLDYITVSYTVVGESTMRIEPRKNLRIWGAYHE